MDNSTSRSMQLVSYDQIYKTKVRPKIEAIDIFLKENTAPFRPIEVAAVLDIEEDELLPLMAQHSLKEIDTTAFFTLIFSGSSPLCGYIKRQWKYQHLTEYTPAMIAEIYKLNLHKVQIAFDDIGATHITDAELIDVFKRIHVTHFGE